MSSRELETIAAVRKGLPATELEKLVRKLAIERTVLLNVLGMSARTLQRKHHRQTTLTPAASDRLARVERIYALATDVFADETKAAEWLKRPSRALDSRVPIELLDTDAGTQTVEQELRRIQHGFVF
jgi:putative toxin-antitoxin system antitoxin component (TIGR02293 family)